jgi:hypothetical protein
VRVARGETVSDDEDDPIDFYAESLGIIPMMLRCPMCSFRHIDDGEWTERPHRTHLCRQCAHEWRPANVYTRGVEALPVPRKSGPSRTCRS